jgi:hypothetical protein
MTRSDTLARNTPYVQLRAIVDVAHTVLVIPKLRQNPMFRAG